MNKQQGVDGITQNIWYGMGAVVLVGAGLWLWQWAAFALPIWGMAPQMVSAVGLGYVPVDPQPVYLWLGQLIGILFSADVGLRVLALLGSILGVGAVMFVVHRLTADVYRTLLSGLLLVLFPLLMRLAVVQEAGAVLFGLLALSFAFLLSNHAQKFAISGVLFGVAVGVHPTALLTALGFVWVLRAEGDDALKRWGVGALAAIGLGWLWLFFLFRSSGASGSWLAYMLGGIGEGYGGFGPGDLLSGLVRQVSVLAHLFGWGGFVFGFVGVVLMAFQNRDHFIMVVCYVLPFFLYQLPRVSGGDEGVFLAVWGPVLAIGLGTVWREGSRYLAEGLQETVQTMLWVVAVALVIVQGVCVFYTQNTWEMALARRAAYATKFEQLVDMSKKIQDNTNSEDVMVVIPEDARPGAFGVVASPWAVAWQTQRQVIWASGTKEGWRFYTTPKRNTKAWQWMHVETLVEDAFLAETLRAGHHLVSPEPFPFLHAEQVKTWMSALPAPGFEAGKMFRLVPGWPQVEDATPVVDAYHTAFETYVARGYSADAAACLEGIIVYHPNDVETHRKLGDLYMKLGTYKRAAVIYAKLLALTPNDPEVVVNLSGAYYSQGDVDQAIAVCEAFLAQQQIDPNVLFNLGGYYRQVKRTTDARNIYQAYLALGELGEKHEEVKEILKSLEQE